MNTYLIHKQGKDIHRYQSAGMRTVHQGRCGVSEVELVGTVRALLGAYG